MNKFNEKLNIIIIDDWPDFTEERMNRLKALGNVKWLKGRLVPDKEFIEFAKDADILMVSHHGVQALSREILEKLPKLKMIAQLATGYDYLDLKAAVERNIVACNVPGYASNSAAEHAIGLMLSLSKNIYRSCEQMKHAKVFDFRQNKGFELFGKTLGLVGCGHIGSSVAEKAKVFGMNVIVFDKKVSKEFKAVEFDELVKESDIISLHVPLTSETKNLFSMKQFKEMKNSAIIVNTARAPLINQEDLLKALDEGEIAGYATDLVIEPFDPKDPLPQHQKVVVTPHIAWYTNEAVSLLTEISVKNVEAFVKGKPVNVVNKQS